MVEIWDIGNDPEWHQTKVKQIRRSCPVVFEMEDGPERRKLIRGFAVEYGETARTIKKVVDRERRLARFSIRLRLNDGFLIPAAEVVTDKDFMGACKKVVRAFPGTFKRLELQGYFLTDGKHEVSLEVMTRGMEG